MRSKQLIEKLEDLAASLALAKEDAERSARAAEQMKTPLSVSYHEGREVAFETAFKKVDGIIKEAKK